VRGAAVSPPTRSKGGPPPVRGGFSHTSARAAASGSPPASHPGWGQARRSRRARGEPRSAACLPEAAHRLRPPDRPRFARVGGENRPSASGPARLSRGYTTTTRAARDRPRGAARTNQDGSAPARSEFAHLRSSFQDSAQTKGVHGVFVPENAFVAPPFGSQSFDSVQNPPTHCSGRPSVQQSALPAHFSSSFEQTPSPGPSAQICWPVPSGRQ
jgi:hypothetical protein